MITLLIWIAVYLSLTLLVIGMIGVAFAERYPVYDEPEIIEPPTVTAYVEPEHVRYQREFYAMRRDKILQASKREMAEARAAYKVGG